MKARTPNDLHTAYHLLRRRYCRVSSSITHREDSLEFVEPSSSMKSASRSITSRRSPQRWAAAASSASSLLLPYCKLPYSHSRVANSRLRVTKNAVGQEVCCLTSLSKYSIQFDQDVRYLQRGAPRFCKPIVRHCLRPIKKYNFRT